ncbi:response regulator [Chitinophaga pinensis]|uniref:Response regulator receiver protein n=1 Tax=Chitinophaga pinensis (strain ATCC 43595 / DSM 2588 / LMG 13176 / NBRC 15968 / NCIMB 11800 / UQM 2034) TaxID=485918 RepID=A0A979G313_CHIPD|nr:response regulator [Chitinophaga pinensis]ACU59846.1 response regulator receiver protein [Chitinophaga pinensis DSM 2588]
MSARILLIEDKAGLLDTLKSLLELHNYTVYTASNGQEGLSIANRYLPDLVISDITMPVLNGYALLDSFRIDPQLSKIPVLIASAKNEAHEIELVMQKGAAGYLTKPFVFAHLHQEIKRLLGNSMTASKE